MTVQICRGALGSVRGHGPVQSGAVRTEQGPELAHEEAARAQRQETDRKICFEKSKVQPGAEAGLSDSPWSGY